MELDIRIGNESLSLPIDDPFRLDMKGMMGRIDAFLKEKGIEAGNLDITGLIPQMVKGIAGCEKGCPANAKSLVRQGFGSFHLEYIEGGILTATTSTNAGRKITLKMFPDF